MGLLILQGPYQYSWGDMIKWLDYLLQNLSIAVSASIYTLEQWLIQVLYALHNF